MIQIEYKLVDKSRVKTLQVLLTRIHSLSITSSIAQSQLQAAVSERENWKQRAEQLADVCETMQLVNRLKWLVSLSLLLFSFCIVQSSKINV